IISGLHNEVSQEKKFCQSPLICLSSFFVGVFTPNDES
ncbi:unnamed protein product, partial [Arabidopsis halleri]